MPKPIPKEGQKATTAPRRASKAKVNRSLGIASQKPPRGPKVPQEAPRKHQEAPNSISLSSPRERKSERERENVRCDYFIFAGCASLAGYAPCRWHWSRPRSLVTPPVAGHAPRSVVTPPGCWSRPRSLVTPPVAGHAPRSLATPPGRWSHTCSPTDKNRLGKCLKRNTRNR